MFGGFGITPAAIATSESLFRLKPSNRKQYGSPPTPVRHGQNKAGGAGESVQERKESKGGCKDARRAYGLYRGYKVRDRLTERLLSSFTVF